MLFLFSRSRTSCYHARCRTNRGPFTRIARYSTNERSGRCSLGRAACHWGTAGGRCWLLRSGLSYRNGVDACGGFCPDGALLHVLLLGVRTLAFCWIDERSRRGALGPRWRRRRGRRSGVRIGGCHCGRGRLSAGAGGRSRWRVVRWRLSWRRCLRCRGLGPGWSLGQRTPRCHHKRHREKRGQYDNRWFHSLASAGRTLQQPHLRPRKCGRQMEAELLDSWILVRRVVGAAPPNELACRDYKVTRCPIRSGAGARLFFESRRESA